MYAPGDKVLDLQSKEIYTVMEEQDGGPLCHVEDSVGLSFWVYGDTVRKLTPLEEVL